MTWPTLIRVLNPNPRPIYLLRENVHIDTVGTGEERMVISSDTLRVLSPRGTAKVVFREEREDGLGEEWVQAIGQDATRPDPARAIGAS